MRETSGRRILGEIAPRVLLVADRRSPTTWGWVEAVRGSGVIVLGTDGRPWPASPPSDATPTVQHERMRKVAVALAQASPKGLEYAWRTRDFAKPAMSAFQGRRLRSVIDQVQPDLVHALRLPFEAYTALTACPAHIPLAVSVWGNDLSMRAPMNKTAGRITRQVLDRASLLFCDCQNDVKLASLWGLRAETPVAVLPGGGGIMPSENGTDSGRDAAALEIAIDTRYLLIVNARGVRDYIRNDTLLAALSLLAPELGPDVRIVFVDAAKDSLLRGEVVARQLDGKVIITGRIARASVMALFRRADISVSISSHDGTPNSLLEAMYEGAIPVCGDIPSVREWITDGSNGFLAAFDSPPAVAGALRSALLLPAAERERMKTENRKLVISRVARDSVGRRAASLYRSAIGRESSLSCASAPGESVQASYGGS